MELQNFTAEPKHEAIVFGRSLKAAIPDNDIHVRTVADSIILTGSVASAGDAQKALDIASGFLASRQATAAGGAPAEVTSGKVVNSLIIRGLDQVSLRGA